MKQHKKLFLIMLTVFIYGCELNDKAIINTFNHRISQFQKELAPDLSLNVFEVSLHHDGDKWKLTGETTVSEAKQPILALTDSLLGQETYLNELKILPDEALGDSTYGIIKVSVVPLRRQPKHSSEMIDQTILGNTVRLLKTRRSWKLIQTNYGYIGWVMGGSFIKTDQSGIKAWENANGIIITDLQCKGLKKADLNSQPVSDLVMNSRLILESGGKQWSKVKTPDDKEVYLLNNSFRMERSLNLDREARIAAIIKTANSLMGVPYLWGGNSSKANDCSGYTQTVFNAFGIRLPRDARQQVLVGEEIKPDESFSNVQSGDLFFFGMDGRTTHVGIGLGGSKFIHQSSWIHINSLNPDDDNFNAYRKRTFQKIKRIF